MAKNWDEYDEWGSVLDDSDAAQRFIAPKQVPTEGEQLQESGEFLPDPEIEDLSGGVNYIETNPEMQQIYNRDRAANDEFDRAVRQGNLKEGVKIRQRRYNEGVQPDGENTPLNILGGAWDIGTSFLPDYTSFTDLSEFYMDAKAASTAAGIAFSKGVKNPAALGAAGLAGVGIGRLKRSGIRSLWNELTRNPNTLKLDDAIVNLGDGTLGKLRPSSGLGDAATVTQNLSKMTGSGSNKPSGWDQIPEEHRINTKPVREADKLARANKEKIRKYVQEFGGTEEDVIRIWKEHVLKEKNVKQSRTWLNEYWDKLINYVDSAGNLNEFAIKNIDGKPTLVNTLASGKVIKHPFEVDHSKAKALMAELGIEGADFHENLDIVYSVFNRAKSDFGVIPDDILRATGQSTSLRELVQRSLDTDFNAKFTRIPERLRVVARQMLLEDVLNSVPIKGKPGKIRQQIIDKHLKFWDKNSELIVQLDDYIPEEILKDVDFFANPQQGYESLLNMGVLDSLKPAIKKRLKSMAAQWVTLSDKSKTIGDYVERTGGRQIKKKYNK